MKKTSWFETATIIGVLILALMALPIWGATNISEGVAGVTYGVLGDADTINPHVEAPPTNAVDAALSPYYDPCPSVYSVLGFAQALDLLFVKVDYLLQKGKPLADELAAQYVSASKRLFILHTLCIIMFGVLGSILACCTGVIWKRADPADTLSAVACPVAAIICISLAVYGLTQLETDISRLSAPWACVLKLL